MIHVQIMRYKSEHLAHTITVRVRIQSTYLWMVCLFECKVGCIRETSMMGRGGTVNYM